VLSPFENRAKAGRRLAELLTAYRESDAVVIGIAKAGILVAAEAAKELRLPWGFIVTRRLPVPSSPKTDFGAIASDGTMALNHEILRGMGGLSKAQIDSIAKEVAAKASIQADTYSQARHSPEMMNRPVIVVDDGLASGYTTLAAIKSLRLHNPSRVIAAAPVSSRSAAAMIEEAADECVFEIISPSVPFAISHFYVLYRALTDEDILPTLKSE
jgi:putative phosphoribosyl transferase